VHFIGVGEQMDDLEPFEARDFARAIAGWSEAQSLMSLAAKSSPL
jgi:signal recognition particle GTPase